MTLNAQERSKREQRRQGTLDRRVLKSGWQVQSAAADCSRGGLQPTEIADSGQPCTSDHQL